MKIGLIGLGDIAEKAYLPVISKTQHEISLYTRNEVKLKEIAEKYRFSNIHRTLESMIEEGISAAFVHAATSAHEDIIEQLLNKNIHVYVDKPITFQFDSVKKLTELAGSRNLVLMTGFNRRFAPVYKSLKSIQDINMIVMQKNRIKLPADVRTFVFDDFIHVVDTLRYLFPYPIDNLIVNGRKENGLLHHVVVQLLSNNGCTAIGIMNRDSGAVQEKLEVFSPGEKREVLNVNESFQLTNKNTTHFGTGDWEPVLCKRGFEQIVDSFLKSVMENKESEIGMYDALETHRICEEVVRVLEC
ncbi:MAG: Gfo/Idh/MocA family protein [Cytophagaceae bacterium]